VLQLLDGHQIPLNQEQIARPDLRLSYVQHPFPAQRQTTSTTHLIVAEHATQEGSYVGLTRARQSTHIYAATTNSTRAPRTKHLPRWLTTWAAQNPTLPRLEALAMDGNESIGWDS